MKYLLDTCIVSEFAKLQPNQNVITWLSARHDFYLSVLALGEIIKGVERLPASKKQVSLRLWVNNDLQKRFHNKIINIDTSVVRVWGKLTADLELSGRSLPAIDGLIAASAIANNCTIVSRNTKDFPSDFVEIINPFNT